jgi:UDP-N-acetylglucosamine:LPS N-acetylglucosamine transferase
VARVLLVSSSGGHLDHLLALRPWWSQHQRLWVTFDKPDTRSVLTDEQTTWAHHPTTRNVPNLLRNLWVAWRSLRRWRPDVVVSSGAGVALPFFVLARVMGIRTVYLEVYDRIESTTLTGRLCRPLSSLFLVQWPSQLDLYPGSVLIGELM